MIGLKLADCILPTGEVLPPGATGKVGPKLQRGVASQSIGDPSMPLPTEVKLPSWCPHCGNPDCLQQRPNGWFCTYCTAQGRVKTQEDIDATKRGL